MKVGCQTFTWEMLGDAYKGSVDDIVDAIAGAGYAGIEISSNMIGGYKHNASEFKTLLGSRHLELVAYAMSTASGFTVEQAAEQDVLDAVAAMDLLSQFPGAVLALGCPTDHRGVGDMRAIDLAAQLFNRIGEIGRSRGIPVAVHPSSHHGSAVTRRAHYERLMQQTDPALVGWVPDTGHILRGDQNINETLTIFRDRIAYVHLKDADRSGAWQMMGRGDGNIAGVVSHLRFNLGFDGWIVAEEESPLAEEDPAGAIRADRRFLRAAMDHHGPGEAD